MKYSLLTKEQLDALHSEFAFFLASQQIDAQEWNRIKVNKPEVVLEELQIFSDMVWEDVLTKVEYLEHCSAQHLHLFKCETHAIHRIDIKINTDEIDLTTSNGLDWVLKHLKDEKVAVFKGKKTDFTNRNAFLFNLIEQGSEITKGDLYRVFNSLIG